MTKREAAETNFLNGYNCAQAVLLAFTKEAGLPEEQAAKLASSFGGGMGRLREVCGAVSAMCMVSGLVDGYADPSDKQAKTEHYARIQSLAAAFKEKNETIVCRELLKNLAGKPGPAPEERTPAYYAARPCARFVGDAAEILEAYFKERDKV